MTLLPVGSLDAKSFLKAMRDSRSREDKMSAIAGYVGYDATGQFGNQEMLALMKAQREIKPLTIGKLAVKASPTVAGYVKGLPNHTGKQLQDLLGREKLTAEAMAAFSNEAENTALTEETRSEHRTRAKLENNRLINIRKEIQALTK